MTNSLCRDSIAIKILLLFMLSAIWLSDIGWWYLAPDVLVILGLLPIAWFLALKSPLERGAEPPEYLIFATLVICVGILTHLMTLIAFSWAWFAVSYLLPKTSISRKRLCLVCAGAFPWILMDWQVVSWWFRLSGASFTGNLFSILKFDVVIHGTQIEIGGFPISVEAACGGLQLLQVLFSGGIVLILFNFPRSNMFWIMLILLPILAWLSNTTRIVVITAWGLLFGAESAAGAFHTWGALVVLTALLVLYLFTANIFKRLIHCLSHYCRFRTSNS